MNIALRMLSGGLVLAGVLSVGWSGVLVGADPPKKPAPVPQGTAPAKAPAKQASGPASKTPAEEQAQPPNGPEEAQRELLQAEIDRALTLIADDKIETLIDDYYPLDAVRLLRKRQATANAANDLRRTKAVLRRLQDRLTRSRNGRFEGNNDEVVIFPAEEPAGDAAAAVTPKETPGDSDVAGYGDDLKTVLEAALADLKANEFESFLTKMLPVSALEKLQDQQQLTFNAKLYELYPAMAQAMITDLEAITQLPLKAEADVVRLQLSGRSPGEAEREVRFQLVGGSWRFYDQASELQAGIDSLMQRGEKLAADPNAFEPLLRFERIRDHWRLMELP